MFSCPVIPVIQDLDLVTLDIVIYKYKMKTAGHLTQ